MNKHFFLFICIFAALSSCQSEQPKTNTANAQDSLLQNLPITTSSIKLMPCISSSEEALYATASLEWAYQSAVLKGKVAEFPLGSPSPDEQKQPAALNPKSNHLHWNINNEKHIITNKPASDISLPDGQYPVFGFLVRSYNTLIKNSSSYIAEIIEVKDGKIIKTKKTTSPALAYSSPLGLFRNEEGDKIVLDFLLINTELAPQGNKVRAILNASDTFFIDKAIPYYIEGVGLGEHTLQLELFDAQGKSLQAPIQGKFIVNEEKKKS